METKEIVIPTIVKKAEALKIENPKDMEKASELLSQLNRELDALTADKEKITKPLNATLKEVRERYKPAETRLEEGIAIIRKLMSSYQTEQTRIAEEKAQKIAERVGPGKGRFLPETASEKINQIDKPEESITVESGSVKFRKVEKFELEDISKVPSEFLLLDEIAVRNALKNGQKITGIRYFSEQIPINSRK